MSKKKDSSRFQEVIEVIEELPRDDQAMLIEILKQRLIQHRRGILVSEISEARSEYRRGDVRRGTPDDLMGDLAG